MLFSFDIPDDVHEWHRERPNGLSKTVDDSAEMNFMQ
ncbi:hypothetical protein FHT32_000172 [Variovorax sp. SG517]|nr:hypothetical protein [Variovorax sp. SG517]